MEDCLFCKIGKKEIAVKAVAVNETAVAFMDINPVAPGHTVVIPKKHAAAIMEMDDAELSSLFLLVRQAASQIQSGLACDGLNIGINQGKAAGWGVPHVHVHIIPRFENDGGGSMHTIVRNPPHESIDAIYEKIRAREQEKKPEPAREEKKPAPKKLPPEWELEL